jgi:hypothetical protein
MEDGSVADPSDVRRDESGVLRHRDGRVVAMRGDVPRSRSVDTDQIKTGSMTAEQPVRRYKTRESKAQ